MLCTVFYPKGHAPACMLTFNILREVEFYMCPYDFLKQTSLSSQMTLWVYQYGDLHQFESFLYVAPGLLVFYPVILILRVLI